MNPVAHERCEAFAVKLKHRLQPIDHVTNIERVDGGDPVIVSRINLQNQPPLAAFCRGGELQPPGIDCLMAADQEWTLVEGLPIQGPQEDPADGAAAIPASPVQSKMRPERQHQRMKVKMQLAVGVHCVAPAIRSAGAGKKGVPAVSIQPPAGILGQEVSLLEYRGV